MLQWEAGQSRAVLHAGSSCNLLAAVLLVRLELLPVHPPRGGPRNAWRGWAAWEGPWSTAQQHVKPLPRSGRYGGSGAAAASRFPKPKDWQVGCVARQGECDVTDAQLNYQLGLCFAPPVLYMLLKVKPKAALVGTCCSCVLTLKRAHAHAHLLLPPLRRLLLRAAAVVTLACEPSCVSAVRF